MGQYVGKRQKADKLKSDGAMHTLMSDSPM